MNSAPPGRVDAGPVGLPGLIAPATPGHAAQDAARTAAAATGASSIDRWSLLSGLRFVLAMVVATVHLTEFADLGAWVWLPRLGAFEAILGFLMVSGFSIAESYRARPEGYLLRRVRRVYPVYLFAMAATWLADWPAGPGVPVADLLANALMLNQLVTTHSFVGPAWSLSLEFWLYLLAPTLARWSPSRLRVAIALSVLTYAVFTMGRSLFHWPYHSGLGYGLNLPTLAFAWLAGWWLAVRAEGPGAWRLPAAAMAAHWVLALGIQCVYRWKHAAWNALPMDLLEHAQHGLTLVLALMVLRTAAQGRGHGRRSGLLDWLGNVSYPLYLLHYLVFVVLQRAGVHNAVVMLAAALGSAALAHQVLERKSKA